MWTKKTNKTGLHLYASSIRLCRIRHLFARVLEVDFVWVASDPVCRVSKRIWSDFHAFDAENEWSHQWFCRLKPRHRVIAAGGMPPIEYEWERKRSAQRERFGTYGVKSGIDPSICWPTVEVCTIRQSERLRIDPFLFRKSRRNKL